MNNKTNKLLSLALSVSILATIPMAASAAFFGDTQNHWAAADINTLSNQGVLTGYPDGSFRPQGLITRAEFAATLVKALGMNTSIGASANQDFTDVPRSHWAFPAIQTVKASGLVSGYPNALFLPNRSISRAEAMAILANAAQVPMLSEAQTTQVLSQFRDAGAVPAWARPGVAAAIQAGIFANDPNQMTSIEPMTPATRAEVAAMVQDLMIARGGGNNTNVATGTGSTTGGTTSGSTTMQNQGGRTVLQGHVATVPANTRFTGTVTAPISSELNKVGDTVTLNVDQALVSTDNRVIVPAGSQIVGKVSMIEPSGRTGKPAKLDVDFNEIVTPDGQRYQIQGSVATEEGMLVGGTTKGRILKAAGATAVGAGLGAALGTAMGPLSGGEVGKGAIYGTAVGAGVGALAAAAMKGKDVTVTAGDRLEIKLDQPITVQVSQ